MRNLHQVRSKTDTPAAVEVVDPAIQVPLNEIGDFTWFVSSGSAVIAKTDRPLVLREASYPAIFYVPFDDVCPPAPGTQRSSHLVPITQARPPITI